jgi:hypothetical protein
VPFTGSHPAAVLPLLRTPLPASALVIGSMTPDLPLYVRRLDLTMASTHSTAGILTVDLLVGLLAWAVWHGVLSAPALAALPDAARDRLAAVEVGLRSRLRRGPRHLALVVAALLVGSLTHVVWDSFTHDGRWGSEHVAALSRTYGPWTGAQWAQVVCSVAGLVAVAAVLAARWGASAPHRARRSRSSPARRSLGPGAAAAWLLVLCAAGAGGLAGLEAHREAGGGLHGLPLAVLTRAGAAAGAVALVLALGWHLRPVAGRRVGGRG